MWRLPGACRRVTWSIVVGVSGVSTMRSPMTLSKAPTLHAVVGSPSKAMNGRFSGVYETGLP